MKKTPLTHGRPGRLRRLLLGVVSIGLIGAIYSLFLDHPARASAAEAAAYQADYSLASLLHNPLGAPYRLAHFALMHIWPHSLIASRLASVVWALIAIGLFYLLTKRWYGRPVALLAAALFAASGWLLHTGRLGDGLIIYSVLPLALLLLGSWLNTTARHGSGIIAWAVLFGVSLFIPGGVWFEAAFLVAAAGLLWRHTHQAQLWQQLLAGLIIVGSVGSCVLMLVRAPELLRPWLGVISALPEVSTGLKQLVESGSFFFVRGPYMPDRWLAHIPLFDVLSSGLFVLGTIFYGRHIRTKRSQLLLMYLIIGGALVALNGALALSFMLPIMYLIGAAGLAYLLHQWLSVFPRNPLARASGIALISGAVLLAVSFHLSAYYIAWQRSPHTAGAFQHQL